MSLCGLTRCLGRPRCAASLTTEGLQLLQSHVGYMKGALESLQSKIGERYLAPPFSLGEATRTDAHPPPFDTPRSEHALVAAADALAPGAHVCARV